MSGAGDLTPQEFWYGCREAAHWFVPYVLGFENAGLHDELQWHLDESDNAYCEMPRGHGKTNQMVGRVCWEIGRNPHIRVKIVGSSDDEATKTVTLIRKVIQSERVSGDRA
jgi:dihydrofolate reductase